MHIIIKNKKDKRKEKFTVIKCSKCGQEKIHQSQRLAERELGEHCTCGGKWIKIN